MPGLWLIHTASVFYLYGWLIPRACELFKSSLALGEIVQTMSQTRYYYLYLSIPLNIFLILQIRRKYEFEIMKLRLWTKKHLPGLGWVLLVMTVIAIFLCSLNKAGG